MILDKKINVFLAVVEAGNFSSAGRRLSLSQSVVSFHIESLEKELGIMLFKRQGRTISLTDEAEFFYEKVKEISTNALNLEGLLTSYSSNLSNKINLAGNAATCAFVIPPVLTEFKKQDPKTQFSYKYMEHDDIVDSLVDEQLDLAFVGHPVKHRKLITKECFHDKIILVGAPDVVPDTISVKDLPDYPLFWLKQDKGLEFLLSKHLNDAGVPSRNLDIFLELENITILKNFVRAGAGITFLPAVTVAMDLECNLLKEIKVEELTLERDTYMVYRKEKTQKEIITRLISFIEDKNKIS